MIETMAETATKARDRYLREPRLHAIAQSVVAYVMQEHGRIDPERADREADEIATKVAAMVIERMFSEDQELAAQRELAERYRKLAEDALAVSLQPHHILRPGQASGTFPAERL